MNEKLNRLKKILLENQDKKVLVLSASETSIQKIYQFMAMGKLYNHVLDELLIKEFGAIEKWYVTDNERKRMEEQIKIEKGKPLFSTQIVDCDFIIFLKIEPKVLKIVCDYEKTEYFYILRRQQELLQEIDAQSYPLKVFEIYPKDSDLAQMSRNVYLCGSLYYSLIDKRELDEFTKENHFHFPYIKKVDKLEDLKRKQGFLLIIGEDKLPLKEIMEIDKKYRKLFNHFQFVYILTEDEKKLNFYHLKYSNIYFVNQEYPDDDSILELYYKYLLNSKKIKLSKNKKASLEKIHLYLKKKDIVTTKEIAKKFSLTLRSVERYMHDYNKIYKNIGYDFKRNAWYIIH